MTDIFKIQLKSFFLKPFGLITLTLGVFALVTSIVNLTIQQKELNGILDLIHWGLGHIFVFFIGIFALSMVKQNRLANAFIFAGIASYLIGEIIYTILVALKIDDTPNISDLFFIASPTLFSISFFIMALAKLKRFRSIFLYCLDFFGLWVGLVAIIHLGLVPVGISHDSTTSTIDSLYPLMYGSAFIACFLVFIHLEGKTGLGMLFLTAVLGVQTVLWYLWIDANTKTGVPSGSLLGASFTWLELIFAFVYLYKIVGNGLQYTKSTRFIKRLLPFVALSLSLIPFVLHTLKPIPEAKMTFTLLTSLIIVFVIAIIRQIGGLRAYESVEEISKQYTYSHQLYHFLYEGVKNSFLSVKIQNREITIVEANSHAKKLIEGLDIENKDEYRSAILEICEDENCFESLIERQIRVRVSGIEHYFKVYIRGEKHKEESNFIMLYILIQDLTEAEKEAQELEEKIRTRSEELHEKSEEVERALANYNIAKDELVRAEKFAALGSMVGGIAHELNTPIGLSITLSTALEHQVAIFLKDNPHIQIPAMFGESLDLLTKNLKRAAELMSSFKQVAVDQMSSARRNFDIKEVIGEIIRLQKIVTKFKKIGYEIQTEDSVELSSYPGPLGQVLQNLIQNAVMHGFEGRETGQVLISWRKIHEKSLRIIVSDDGVGMSSDIIEQIFTPFYTTKRGRGGSGLGLAIVDKIVTDTLGGKIEVSSSIGEGARFLIEIPLHAPDPKPTEI